MRVKSDVLLIHTQQSAETMLVVRAIDTIRRQYVEQEWYRHLVI